MNDDKRCLWTRKGMKCFSQSNGTGAFDSSRSFFVKKIEDMDTSAPFSLVKNCSIQGTECFNRNIRNAVVFFFYMLVAGLMLNFLHEIVHYMLLLFIGKYDAVFTFSANGGFTVSSFPIPGDPSIPWYWWFFELMGPLVLVNFPIVLVTMSAVNHDEKMPPLSSENVSIGFHRGVKNFLKSIAYTSAFVILINTFFSPFYNLLYTSFGFGGKPSDLSIAWEVSTAFPVLTGNLMRMVIIATTGIMISVTIIYIFLFNRRETGE